jgi:hypothetical protein
LSFDIPLALVLLVLLTRRGGLWGSESTGGSPAITASAAARPKPVPPPRSGDQREAARLKGLRLTAERKRLRARLQAGELTLAQALAQDKEAARGMRIVTVVRALPGIGAATAARLITQAGIDAARRVGALTVGADGAPAGRRGGRRRGAGHSSRPAHGARRPGAPGPRAWLVP